MIRYRRSSWWSQVFVIRGGIIQVVQGPIAAYFIFLLVLYVTNLSLSYVNADLDRLLVDEQNSMKFLGGFVSFLLIFRLNQCYMRFTLGRDLTAEYYSGLSRVVTVSCSYLRGANGNALVDIASANGELDEETYAKFALLALTAEIHIVRLVVAIGVALKFHCRLAEAMQGGGEVGSKAAPLLLFDYRRVKGLLYPREQILISRACGIFSQSEPADTAQRSSYHVNFSYQPKIQSGYWQTHSALETRSNPKEKIPEEDFTVGVALPVMLMQILRDYVAQPLGQTWGYPERIVNLLETDLNIVSRSFEHMDRLITLPLPLPYLQHCKLLFLAFITTYPLTIKVSDGAWANVVTPCLLFFALLGFETLADQLENPLGDDEADLNILEMIHDLEVRSYEAFNVAESLRTWLRKDAEQPMLATGFKGVRTNVVSEIAQKVDEQLKQDRDFRTHFKWLPLPPQILRYLVETEFGIHGQELDLYRELLHLPSRASGHAFDGCPPMPPANRQSQSSFTRFNLCKMISNMLPNFISGENDAEDRDDFIAITHFLCLAKEDFDWVSSRDQWLPEEDKEHSDGDGLDLLDPDAQSTHAGIPRSCRQSQGLGSSFVGI